jgi:hypothetical protein
MGEAIIGPPAPIWRTLHAINLQSEDSRLPCRFFGGGIYGHRPFVFMQEKLMTLLFPYLHQKYWTIISSVLLIASIIEGFNSPILIQMALKEKQSIGLLIGELILVSFIIGTVWGLLTNLFVSGKSKLVQLIVIHFYLFPLYYDSLIGYPIIWFILHFNYPIGIFSISFAWGIQIIMQGIIKNLRFS